MITVQDLINKLTSYAAASPENGNIEVMLGSSDEVCYEFSHANDAKGIGENLRFLIFIPNIQGKHFGVKHMNLQ